jgi:hypothetical protein
VLPLTAGCRIFPSPKVFVVPQRSTTKRVALLGMWALRLSQTTCHGASGGAEANKSPRRTTRNQPRCMSRHPQ